MLCLLALTAELAAQGVDADALLARREEVRDKRMARATATDDNLDGKSVRIPGYVLPLEFEDTGVTAFLLVPYVGACIHAPPPLPTRCTAPSMG